MLEHGGNLTQAAKTYGIPLTSWLDLSTGINPQLYPVPSIPSQVWQRLPDANEALIAAACAYYGCQSLLPTAGSQAVIQVLPRLRPSCHIAMPKTMYQEHAHAWKNHGHTVTFFDELPDEKILKKTDVLLLCNPNNPTGKRYPKSQLLAWHAMLAARGAWLVIDEAFMDMTPAESLADYAHQEGLFVLRSLGKFFGLAGARIGFLIAHKSMLNAAKEIIGPWTVTGPSEFVATQALLDTNWQTNTRQQLATKRIALQALLKDHDFTLLGNTDLFQLASCKNAALMHQALAKQGVWTRLFENIPALRFGLPPDMQWHPLEDALKATR